MIIPDINLLIYAHDATAPHHATARSWWEATVNGPDPVGLPWVVILGFVRLLSSPRVVLNPRAPAELLGTLERILERPRVSVVAPGSRHAAIMRKLFEDIGGSSRLVTDVHLAALAVEHNAILATNDVDFSRFSGLKVNNPLS